MNNKNIISISFFILSIAVVYFLVVYLPQKERTSNDQISLENSKACQEAALLLHKQETSGNTLGVTEMEPRFKYVEEEKLCVYKGGFIQPNLIHEYLKDVMTNETLSEYMIHPNGIVIYGDKDAFEKLEREYFLGITY